MPAPHCVSGFRQSGDRSWRVRAHPRESAPAGVSHRSALRCGFAASLYAACRLLAELYLACGLPAIATKGADLHDSACGYLRAGDSTVHRLPLRPARWLDAFNLEEANESGGAKQARGHLLVLMTARRLRQSFLAERVLPDAGGVWGMKSVEPLQLLRGSFARSSHCGRDSQR